MVPVSNIFIIFCSLLVLCKGKRMQEIVRVRACVRANGACAYARVQLDTFETLASALYVMQYLNCVMLHPFLSRNTNLHCSNCSHCLHCPHCCFWRASGWHARCDRARHGLTDYNTSALSSNHTNTNHVAACIGVWRHVGMNCNHAQCSVLVMSHSDES